MEKKTQITRVIGTLTLICTLTLGCSTSKDLYQRPLYSIDKYRIEDNIERTIFREQLLIARELEETQNTAVTLEMYVRQGRTVYSMDIYYTGSDWRYMDEIILNIEGEITTLKDEDPIRVRESDNAVIESLTCFLDEKTYKGLRYCKSLEIQYHNKAIIIPQEGLEAIWNFLREYF